VCDRNGGENLRILGYLVDHWWSAEGCGEGPGWEPVCMGCAYAHQDDGIVEPVSASRLQSLLFRVLFGGLVFREGASVAHEDLARAHGVMRAATDVVGPSVVLTWR
jgi:hypothetical protein